MVAPFAKDEIRGAIVAVNTAVTARPPIRRQGKPTTARPFNQLMKGVSTAGLSPLFAIERSTARRITERMFDEGGAHRSSLTADRQVNRFHAFQDPAE